MLKALSPILLLATVPLFAFALVRLRRLAKRRQDFSFHDIPRYAKEGDADARAYMGLVIGAFCCATVATVLLMEWG